MSGMVIRVIFMTRLCIISAMRAAWAVCMKLPFIFRIRGARDKPKDSYGGSAYSFFFGKRKTIRNC